MNSSTPVSPTTSISTLLPTPLSPLQPTCPHPTYHPRPRPQAYPGASLEIPTTTRTTLSITHWRRPPFPLPWGSSRPFGNWVGIWRVSSTSLSRTYPNERESLTSSYPRLSGKPSPPRTVKDFLLPTQISLMGPDQRNWKPLRLSAVVSSSAMRGSMQTLPAKPSSQVPILRAPPSNGGRTNSRNLLTSSRNPLLSSGLSSGTASGTWRIGVLLKKN